VRKIMVGERQYFKKHFPEVNMSALGNLVGMGAQNVVRAYQKHGAQTPMVIKYPRAHTWPDLFSMGVSPIFTQSPREMSEHVARCMHYFEDRVVPTELVSDLKGKYFYITQEKLEMRVLTLDEYNKRPELKPQLQDIVHRNRRMIRDCGMWFDFMGWDSKRILRDHAYMANVAVVDEPGAGTRLKLFDLSLYPLPSLHPRNWMFGIIYAVQNRNLGRFGHAF
jgi:hypothetical protein